jgi:hypothetical protein
MKLKLFVNITCKLTHVTYSIVGYTHVTYSIVGYTIVNNDYSRNYTMFDVSLKKKLMMTMVV